jgi:putative transcriptional regulator
MDNIIAGKLLIADPFLKDPNFMRSVVFICDHQDEGSFGFVLNRKYNQTIGQLISGLDECSFPVYYGGPVQLDTVHFLHQCPDLITGGVEIINGIYWGGEFEEVMSLINDKILKQGMIRFYIGYSGWGEKQLENELKEKSWLTTDGNKKLVFHRDINLIWQDALKQLGGKYEQLINYPIDPQLN